MLKHVSNQVTDKAAVSGERLIRHEIVAGKVLIHDLNLVLPFKQERGASGGQETVEVPRSSRLPGSH